MPTWHWDCDSYDSMFRYTLIAGTFEETDEENDIYNQTKQNKKIIRIK